MIRTHGNTLLKMTAKRRLKHRVHAEVNTAKSGEHINKDVFMYV